MLIMEKLYFVTLFTKAGRVVTGDLTKAQAEALKAQYDAESKPAMVSDNENYAHNATYLSGKFKIV